MARQDILSRWSGSYSLALISTQRRFRLEVNDLADASRVGPGWDYVEVDNRSNPTAVVFYSFGGTTSSSLATVVSTPTTGPVTKPIFRLPPKYQDARYISPRATSIYILSTVATTVFINVARF